MDEQFKNLKFDMDEEIQEREARIGNSRSRHDMGVGTAIVIAAVILVVGLWGGKYLDDAIQEHRIRGALNEIANLFSTTTQEHQQAHQQAQRKAQQAVAMKKAAADRANKERIWRSYECRFWWDHAPKDPQVIAKAKTMQSCQGGF